MRELKNQNIPFSNKYICHLTRCPITTLTLIFFFFNFKKIKRFHSYIYSDSNLRPTISSSYALINWTTCFVNFNTKLNLKFLYSLWLIKIACIINYLRSIKFIFKKITYKIYLSINNMINYAVEPLAER